MRLLSNTEFSLVAGGSGSGNGRNNASRGNQQAGAPPTQQHAKCVRDMADGATDGALVGAAITGGTALGLGVGALGGAALGMGMSDSCKNSNPLGSGGRNNAGGSGK